jgi:hypothetical protein
MQEDLLGHTWRQPSSWDTAATVRLRKALRDGLLTPSWKRERNGSSSKTQQERPSIRED